MKEYKYKINGNQYNVSVKDIEENIAHVEVNGTHYQVEMEKAPKVIIKPVARPLAPTAPTPVAVTKPAAKSTGKSGVKSPLPGVILDVKVKVGDAVKRGQVIVILEAMKMENNINADKDGTITAVNVGKGDSVLEGTDLVIIE
ncbi:MAG: biotin/lipoyl-binding protein [Prevotellaceae bacterium]|jgi:biotin carboxyl carrier protein|nr:biotin/lipoyl-binding protein [Prevotellaceae bacterium]